MHLFLHQTPAQQQTRLRSILDRVTLPRKEILNHWKLSNYPSILRYQHNNRTFVLPSALNREASTG
jgi:hypothetical protein